MTFRSLREIDAEISRGAKSLWLVHKPISVADMGLMTFASVRFHVNRGDFARCDKLKETVTHATFPFAADRPVVNNDELHHRLLDPAE